MSVIKNKRNLSGMEFYHNAVKLRREMTLLLLRDFGIKDKVRSVESFAKFQDMTDEDREALDYLMGKYHMGDRILEEYPKWFIEQERITIQGILKELIMNITAANTIYAHHISEFNDRRTFQNHAICNCEQLLQEMQFIITIIPVKAEKLMRYVEMIEKEIALLKGWRKSDNKILRRLQEEKKEKK